MHDAAEVMRRDVAAFSRKKRELLIEFRAEPARRYGEDRQVLTEVNCSLRALRSKRGTSTVSAGGPFSVPLRHHFSRSYGVQLRAQVPQRARALSETGRSLQRCSAPGLR